VGLEGRRKLELRLRERRDGGVDQSNRGATEATSSNSNWTVQAIEQSQTAETGKHDRGGCGCGESESKSKSGPSGGGQGNGCGCGQSGDKDGKGDKEGKASGSDDASQDQSASNELSTTQDSSAEADTYQVNVNVPVSILLFGSSNGDAQQSNNGSTTATGNSNATGQWIDQVQSVTVQSVTGGVVG